jgi:hypothetical protein
LSKKQKSENGEMCGCVLWMLIIEWCGQ